MGNEMLLNLVTDEYPHTKADKIYNRRVKCVNTFLESIQVTSTPSNCQNITGKFLDLPLLTHDHGLSMH